MKWIIMVSAFGFGSAVAQVKVGETVKPVSLRDAEGGRVTGLPWHSQEFQGKKVSVVFYIDPDKKSLNENIYPILKTQGFDREKFGSVAIINMAATWIPNMLIESELEKKQKEYPTTIYVKDFNKNVVKAWGIEDDNSDVLLVNDQGKVLFLKNGKLDDREIEDLIKTIKTNL